MIGSAVAYLSYCRQICTYCISLSLNWIRNLNKIFFVDVELNVIEGVSWTFSYKHIWVLRFLSRVFSVERPKEQTINYPVLVALWTYEFAISWPYSHTHLQLICSFLSINLTNTRNFSNLRRNITNCFVVLIVGYLVLSCDLIHMICTS